MSARRVTSTIKLPFLEVVLDGVDLGPKGHPRHHRLVNPHLVLDFSMEVQRAVAGADIERAVECLLSLGDNLLPDDKRAATLLSAQAAMIVSDLPAGILVRRSILEEIYDLAERYRIRALEDMSTAVRRETSDNISSDIYPPLGQQSMPVLRFSGVGYSYEERSVLSNVRFDLMPGEVMMVVGANGSGKSTLLNLAAGAVHPHVGVVEYPIHDRLGDSPRDIMDALGYVPQAPPTMYGRVGEALRLYGRLRGRSHVDIDHEIRRAGLDAYRDEYCSSLSAGFQARLELARVLVDFPTLLVLDEPFASLDRRSCLEYAGLLRDLADSRGVAVLAATHDLSMVGATADTVAIVANSTVHAVSVGRLRTQGSDPLVFEVQGVERESLAAALGESEAVDITRVGPALICRCEPADGLSKLLNALSTCSPGPSSFRLMVGGAEW